jgi:hypothetical protein
MLTVEQPRHAFPHCLVVYTGQRWALLGLQCGRCHELYQDGSDGLCYGCREVLRIERTLLT